MSEFLDVHPWAVCTTEPVSLTKRLYARFSNYLCAARTVVFLNFLGDKTARVEKSNSDVLIGSWQCWKDMAEEDSRRARTQ